MKSRLLVLILLFGWGIGKAQQDNAARRLVFLGGAGELVNGRMPVLQAVKRLVTMDTNTSVVFLGDNINSHGLPGGKKKGHKVARSALDSQLALVAGTGAKAYLLPGEGDWKNGGAKGFKAVVKEQQYVESFGNKNVEMAPKDGCPGPLEIEVGKDVVLLMMNTQWWLHKGDRPGIESGCPTKTEIEVLDDIEDILKDNPEKLIVFASHHPFRSTGMHSGYFTLKQHIFPFTDVKGMQNFYLPLPIVGSVYPLGRSVFETRQDLPHPDYASMVSRIDKALKFHPFVLRVAGHERSMELITDSVHHYITTGNASEARRVSKNKDVKYRAQALGFVVVEIGEDKKVRSKFYEVEPSGDARIGYDETLLDFSRLPELAKDTITVHNYKSMDSVTIPLNMEYAAKSTFQAWMIGYNYRNIWTTPVKYKVFDIKKEKGGLEIEGLGGGQQSKSLQLKDKNGTKWTLRTINKDMTHVLPENIRGTLAHDVVQNIVSAAHPFAPLAIPELAKALDVPTSYPEYFVIPNDEAFGRYRPVFANTVCMLEKAAATVDNSDAKSTFSAIGDVMEDNKNSVDQPLFLKARLLDFLIGDFDRHVGQWKWGITETEKGKTFYPVPRDRDQAFFYSDGYLVEITNNYKMRHMQGLQYDLPKMRWIGATGTVLDNRFLNDLDKSDWDSVLADFKTSLDDTVIRKAVTKFPPEIYAISGDTIAAKLESRRDLMPTKALEYYRQLSRYVNILGSNQSEHFHVSKGDNKGLKVDVYARDSAGSRVKQMYSRTFNRKETKELRLYGFNSNDYFEVDEDVKSAIKLRIIGGNGGDTFNIKGSVPNQVFDMKAKENVIVSRRRTTDMRSVHPEVNSYEEKEMNYDDFDFPDIKLDYNVEDGIFGGMGISRKSYGFRKKPFATYQELYAVFAFVQNAYKLVYNGQFNHAFRKNDIVLHTQFTNPTLNNFFGFGNNTLKIPGASLSYYRVRYRFLDAEAMVRKRILNNSLSISLGPTYNYYEGKAYDNANRIMENPSLVGLDSADVYTRKAYLGGKLAVNVNTLNNALIPTRGIDWTTEFESLTGMNSISKPITSIQSNMTMYASFSSPSKVVAVFHLGGGTILSKSFEYFQAMSLGANNYLRGYRKNRFSGSSMAYGGVELRVKLFDIKSYILPGDFGVVGFNDVGRVWYKGEVSKKWHHSYGGGLYFIPFKTVIISAVTGLSREDQLFNFSIGSKINITF